jgi:hypothetical protein
MLKSIARERIRNIRSTAEFFTTLKKFGTLKSNFKPNLHQSNQPSR